MEFWFGQQVLGKFQVHRTLEPSATLQTAKSAQAACKETLFEPRALSILCPRPSTGGPARKLHLAGCSDLVVQEQLHAP